MYRLSFRKGSDEVAPGLYAGLRSVTPFTSDSNGQELECKLILDLHLCRFSPAESSRLDACCSVTAVMMKVDRYI
jgi:hypothetical protein